MPTNAERKRTRNREYMRQYRASNPAYREKSRQYARKRYHKLTPEQKEQAKARNREWQRIHHGDEGFVEKRRRSTEQVRAQRLKMLDTIKASAGCVRCGFEDSRALDFHHRDSTRKKFSVGLGTTRRLEVLLEEVAKCDVICSNCHRIMHAEERDAGRISQS